MAALLLGPVLPRLYSSGWAPVRELRADLAPVARLAGYLPVRPGREAVLAPWTHGHDVRYWSGRPVVSSPFGVEGGSGALEVDAAFHAADDQAAAEALLAGRQVGLVLISAPLDEWLSLESLTPPGSLQVLHHRRAGRVDDVGVLPTFRQLVAVRLWLWDGRWGELDGRLLEDGPPALDGFRLVGESQATARWRAVGHPVFKLFEPVAGAVTAARHRQVAQRARTSSVILPRSRVRACASIWER